MVPLQRIHSDETYARGVPKLDLESWHKESTETIIASLAPGEKKALRVKPDGRIINGNTRIKILIERGVNVNALPREILVEKGGMIYDHGNGYTIFFQAFA